MTTPIDPSSSHQKLRWAWRISGIAVALLGLWFVRELQQSIPPAPIDIGPAATVLPVSKPLPEFTLADESGGAFTRERLEGHWSFLFFGYTACPSICPITMGTLRDMRQDLVAGTPPLDDAQYLFVSVDPARDDPESLRRYVQHFDPAFRGASGESDQLEILTRELGVFHERTAGGTEERYDFDHTASILLVGPDASLHAVFSPPIDPKAAADAFRAIRRNAARP